jgi:hypothetical protein
MAKKQPAAPSVGAVYADRDARRKGRRVKVVKLVARERKAVCEDLKSKKQTRIGYANLAVRFAKAK